MEITGFEAVFRECKEVTDGQNRDQNLGFRYTLLLCSYGGQEFRHGFTELVHRRDQADYQVTFLRKSVEVSGVDNDSLFLEKTQRKLLIRLHRRDSQDRIPTALDREPLNVFLLTQFSVKVRKIVRNALS